MGAYKNKDFIGKKFIILIKKSLPKESVFIPYFFYHFMDSVYGQYSNQYPQTFWLNFNMNGRFYLVKFPINMPVLRIYFERDFGN